MKNQKITRPEILEAARKCVCGDREQDYGTPENNFRTIARLWVDYLTAMPRVVLEKGLLEESWDIVIGPEDVAAMLALMKLARVAGGNPKNDNWIDCAGYAACGGEIESHHATEVQA